MMKLRVAPEVEWKTMLTESPRAMASATPHMASASTLNISHIPFLAVRKTWAASSCTGASSISSAGSTYASGTDAGSADATSTDSSTSNGGLGGGSPGLSSLGGLSGFHNPFGSISSYFKL
jgi:hypothetical protein